jgi:hypothetical protein
MEVSNVRVVGKGFYTRGIKEERYANSCLHISNDIYANRHFKKSNEFACIEPKFPAYEYVYILDSTMH